MKYGEIWIMSYPDGVGHEYTKERPVLVVESNDKIIYGNTCTIIPLTSNISNRIQDDILIEKDLDNNLYLDSLLKVQHISSFDKSRFIKKIGFINVDQLNSLKEYIKQHFNL